MKIEINFIPVEEKLPIDCWREEGCYEDGCEYRTFDEVLAIVDNDDTNEDCKICIVDYFPTKGFVHQNDWDAKYDGNPWRVTHWAFMPDIKKEKQ